MDSYFASPEWIQIHTIILDLELNGVVTRTFRRLDPQRQQVIVQAILDEAMEKGPALINIKKVAERAEVALGSLYQYFNNRDGLLEFSIQLCVRILSFDIEKYCPMLAAMPLRDALYYYMVGALEWGNTQMGLIRFFGRAAYQGDPVLAEKVVKPVANVMLATIQAILLAAQQRGEIRAELDLAAAARAINTWTIALADSQLLPYLNNYFQVTNENTSFEQVLTVAIDIVVTGLTTTS